MPAPIAVMSVRISSFFSIWSIRAFSTFRIFPRKGRIAWNSRRRPCFADPPADGPSTMNSSLFAGSRSWQSASFPGRLKPSRSPFRRVSSRALRAASRAWAARTAFPMQISATFGVSLKKSVSFSYTIDSTIPLTFELRFRDFQAQDRRQAFPDVVALEAFAAFDVLVVLRVFDERSGETRLEAGEVGASFDRVDVVDEREDGFVVAIVVLHRHFDQGRVGFLRETDRVRVQRRLRAVDPLHVFCDATLELEHVPATTDL